MYRTQAAGRGTSSEPPCPGWGGEGCLRRLFVAGGCLRRFGGVFATTVGGCLYSLWGGVCTHLGGCLRQYGGGFATIWGGVLPFTTACCAHFQEKLFPMLGKSAGLQRGNPQLRKPPLPQDKTLQRALGRRPTRPAMARLQKKEATTHRAFLGPGSLGPPTNQDPRGAVQGGFPAL